MKALCRILLLILLAAASVSGQGFSYPTTTGNNTLSGTNIFTGELDTKLVTYTVGTLPSPPTKMTGLLVVVSDSLTAGSCTSGGGTNYSWCRNSGAAWVPFTSAGAGGTVTGTAAANQVAIFSAASVIGGSTGITVPSTGNLTVTNTVTSSTQNLSGDNPIGSIGGFPVTQIVNQANSAPWNMAWTSTTAPGAWTVTYMADNGDFSILSSDGGIDDPCTLNFQPRPAVRHIYMESCLFENSVAIKVSDIAVASLPAASADNAGQWRYVNNSTAIAAEGQTCVGGSTNKAAAFSNGVVWKCF